MLPTLLIGDHLYADLHAYDETAPSRGDVVVYRMARNDSGSLVPYTQLPEVPAGTFIKRIIGIPGDSIRFDGATLYVNGERKTGDPSPETLAGPRGESVRVRPESLGAHSYFVWDDVHLESPDFTVFVEPDHYFLAGDNRDNSNDSRYWGTLHRDDILGRATKLYWSWDFNGTFLELFNPLVIAELLRDKTRWDRIGRHIE